MSTLALKRLLRTYLIKFDTLLAMKSNRNTILAIAEILVMGGILIAFIAPLMVPSQEPEEVGVQQLRKPNVKLIVAPFPEHQGGSDPFVFQPHPRSSLKTGTQP